VKILLGTCTFLWIAGDSPCLSRAAARLFLDPANERYLSVASVWEIGVKHAAGRLPLPERPDLPVPRLREASGIASFSVDEPCALRAAQLPLLHTDPFDRMLIAQALVHGMVILPPDAEIESYVVQVFW